MLSKKGMVRPDVMQHSKQHQQCVIMPICSTLISCFCMLDAQWSSSSPVDTTAAAACSSLVSSSAFVMEPVLGNGLPAKAASGVVLAAADSVDSFCICDAIQGPRGLGGGAGHIMAEEERGLRVEQVPQGPLGLLCLLDVPQHLCEESHGRLGLRYRIGATRSCSRDEQVVGESGGEGPQGHPDGGVCSLCLADGESLRKVNYRSEILASLYPEPGTVIRGSLDAAASECRSSYICAAGSGSQNPHQP